jgi:glycosyltransferase involved in cell wall biosynthesis
MFRAPCEIRYISVMSLRVLTALAGAPVGGAEAFYVALTRALARAKFDVRAVLRPNAEREAALAAAGISCTTAPFGGFIDFSTGPAVKRILRDFQPRIVLAFAGRASSMIPRGAYKVIGRLGGYYNLKNFRRCDYLVCNAPDLVRYVTEGGWPDDRVFHIPNFPDLRGSAPVARQSIGTPEGVPLALALGRFHPNKAMDVLIRAAALIPELHVWIAGEGEERGNLEKLVASLGIASRVKFLGWRADRAGLFASADLCVYPSRAEPFGNVVVEAWGYGVPLVATASVGPAWLIRQGHDAIMTPVDDVQALAVGIRRILSSPDLAKQLVINGRKRVAEEFSEGAVIGRYSDMFDKVLA